MKDDMGFSIYSVVSFGIFLTCSTGFGSALRVVTQPEPLTFLTKELNISCVADRPANSILSIQIMRHMEDKSIASVNMRQILKMAVGIKENVKAEGHIDVTSNKSHLTLIIDKPDRHDAGLYRCQMFFIDEDLQMVEQNVIGNVTYQKPDIIGAVTDLARDVSSILTNLMNQNKTVRTQKDQCADFEYCHSEQKLDMDILKDKIEELQRDNTKKQHQIDILIDNIKLQNETIRTLIMQPRVIRKEALLAQGWTHYKGDSTYIKVFGTGDSSKRLSWYKAREACQTFGTDLVQIHDGNKNKFVFEMCHSSGNCSSVRVWIGIKSDDNRRFNFKYVDGSDLGQYRPWESHQPNGGQEHDETCVEMLMASTYSGRWTDYYCATPNPYACSVSSIGVL